MIDEAKARAAEEKEVKSVQVSPVQEAACARIPQVMS